MRARGRGERDRDRQDRQTDIAMEYFSPDTVFLFLHSKGVLSVQDNFYLH